MKTGRDWRNGNWKEGRKGSNSDSGKAANTRSVAVRNDETNWILGRREVGEGEGLLLDCRAGRHTQKLRWWRGGRRTGQAETGKRENWDGGRKTKGDIKCWMQRGEGGKSRWENEMENGMEGKGRTTKRAARTDCHPPNCTAWTVDARMLYMESNLHLTKWCTTPIPPQHLKLSPTMDTPTYSRAALQSAATAPLPWLLQCQVISIAAKQNCPEK